MNLAYWLWIVLVPSYFVMDRIILTKKRSLRSSILLSSLFVAFVTTASMIALFLNGRDPLLALFLTIIGSVYFLYRMDDIIWV